ncbi:MAG: ATP-binding protein [Actinobacteria bacterium]|nr:ATP-binding protein [Actinomycetota bacterium]
MKQVTIISGKGGTGKTTLASSFIKLATNQIAVDCDVDAANLHILLSPSKIRVEKFIGNAKANVVGTCIKCGKCEELCRFEAICDSQQSIKIDKLKCESCGICEYICPTNAIKLKPQEQGEFYVSDTAICPFVHAKLDPGAENSGLLVTRVRNIAEDIAYSDNKELIIIDGAPGIGCSVIASLNGVDFTVIVTEPTLSGISDFKKIFEVTKFFNIKSFVCINKFDINLKNTNDIENFCSENNVEILGKIPYDDCVPKNLSDKKIIIDDNSSEAGKEIKNIWRKLEGYLYG